MKCSIKKPIAILLFAFGMLLLNSCNKQKAKAIMEAAKMFSIEAIEALEGIEYLNKMSNSAYSWEEMQRDLVYARINAITDLSQINTQLLNTLTQGIQPPIPVQKPMSVQIGKLKEQYLKFSETFDALYQGNYFAKNAVLKTEAHAIRLTLQLIELAKVIETTPYQFTAERAELLARMYKAKTDKYINPSEKSELLEQIAGDIVDLVAVEGIAKEEALLQCLEAAERGKTVAELARYYKKMSLGEMLNIAEGPMSYSLQFLGDREVETVMNEYMDMKSTIEKDPYWGALISSDNK